MRLRDSEHDAEVRTTIIVPPLADAGHDITHREEKCARRVDWNGKREEIPGARGFGSGAYIACLSLRYSCPAVGSEARGNAFIEGDIAHTYDAAEERGPRVEEGEGL
jgi:hypothetical protein